VHQVRDQPRLYYDARSTNHQDGTNSFAPKRLPEIATTRRVTTLKSTVFRYFMAEAWNYANIKFVSCWIILLWHTCLLLNYFVVAHLSLVELFCCGTLVSCWIILLWHTCLLLNYFVVAHLSLVELFCCGTLVSCWIILLWHTCLLLNYFVVAHLSLVELFCCGTIVSCWIILLWHTCLLYLCSL